MWDSTMWDSMVPFYCVAALAILGAVVVKAWLNNEAGKRDTELKLEMVAKGMSADDIERVLAAKSKVGDELCETQPHEK